MSLMELRRDWRQHLDDIDLIIDTVKNDAKVIPETGAIADHAVDARRAWLSKLQASRADVERLLANIPPLVGADVWAGASCLPEWPEFWA